MKATRKKSRKSVYDATMSIPVIKDPDSGPTYERCCFCRSHTSHWTNLLSRKPGEQVACCPVCADRANVGDVPSKMDWWRREVIAEG